MNAIEASLRARRIRRARVLLIEQAIATRLCEAGIPARHWAARIAADLWNLFRLPRTARQVRRDMGCVNVQLAKNSQHEVPQ